MPSHPISLRKTRAVVSKVIDASNEQADRLNQLTEATKALHFTVKARGEQLDSLIDRGFFGRLRWLLTGK